MSVQPSMSLLARCALGFPADDLAPSDRAELDRWWEQALAAAKPLAKQLVAAPLSKWSTIVLDHPAHRHAWYRVLADEVTLVEFAAFMLENLYFPAFLPLAGRVHEIQFLDGARAALARNIEDEQHPVPHADLMRRLMMALKARAGDDLQLDTYPALVNRTLVFYHGFYRDPWALAGALYMTEAVALYRLQGMDRGLRRLKFSTHEREFVDLHMTCDEDHAREWIEEVIAPSIAQRPDVGERTAQGLAVALETSSRYLDALVSRFCFTQSGVHGASPAHAH